MPRSSDITVKIRRATHASLRDIAVAHMLTMVDVVEVLCAAWAQLDDASRIQAILTVGGARQEARNHSRGGAQPEGS